MKEILNVLILFIKRNITIIIGGICVLIAGFTREGISSGFWPAMSVCFQFLGCLISYQLVKHLAKEWKYSTFELFFRVVIWCFIIAGVSKFMPSDIENYDDAKSTVEILQQPDQFLWLILFGSVCGVLDSKKAKVENKKQ